MCRRMELDDSLRTLGCIVAEAMRWNASLSLLHLCVFFTNFASLKTAPSLRAVLPTARR